MPLSDSTIEEVWDWRKKAYGKLEKLPLKDRIKKINQAGSTYAKKLKLSTAPVSASTR